MVVLMKLVYILQDKLGKAANEEDWVMRVLIQAICEHALESRDVPHFNQDRMNKYVNLIHEFGDSKESREANCLFGIQSLIHRLEHPQGLLLFCNFIRKLVKFVAEHISMELGADIVRDQKWHVINILCKCIIYISRERRPRRVFYNV